MCVNTEGSGETAQMRMVSSKEPAHDKTNKITCAASEDSDQPGHMPSLVKVFTSRSVGSLGPKVSS